MRCGLKRRESPAAAASETCHVYTPALRFHPRCFYRPSKDDRPGTRGAFPALIAAVTDAAGTVTGVHRTWLDPEGDRKAEVACPRRAMGQLLGQGVRFGPAGPVMIWGEGIETILSLREVMPTMPMIAGLSAAHLAAVQFSEGLRRLYVARDDDAAGARALATLDARAAAVGIALVGLESRRGDFNDDLQALGQSGLARALRSQLDARDAARYVSASCAP